VVGGQKSAKSVNLNELAEYIERQREKAHKESKQMSPEVD